MELSHEFSSQQLTRRITATNSTSVPTMTNSLLLGSGPKPSICLHLRHPVYGAAETLNSQLENVILIGMQKGIF